MNQDSQPSRTVLPIPARGHVGLTTYDAKDPETSFPPIQPVRPPPGAPNVMIVISTKGRNTCTSDASSQMAPLTINCPAAAKATMPNSSPGKRSKARTLNVKRISCGGRS